MSGGVCVVAAIVLGNGCSDMSSQSWKWLFAFSHNANTLAEDMNLPSPKAMGKQ